MKKTPNIFASLISLTVIALSIYAITNRQDIYDWLALRNYVPSKEVVALADATTMQDSTRRVFYINHPSVDDKLRFSQQCPTGEKSIVLGCYIQSKGIFVLSVSDPRLQGIVEVTAAHETLHAQYDRLSSKERENVDRMTKQFFNQLQDERIKKTIENYQDKDPSVVPNELHSILGTEVRDLSPELETYYAQYFKDRKAIVAYSEKYEQTFVGLKNQVEQYDSRLATLKDQIDTSQEQLKADEAEINSEKKRLDSLLNGRNIEEYNSSVPGFNSMVTRYNNLISSTRQAINEYNSIVEKRNAIATTEKELVQAIDASSLPKTQ
jgi:uncharacterized protein YukE